jgi:N-acyl-D-amino-acid deacylase
MHDIVIRNGTVVDGTGAPRRMADIAIDGSTISLVGTVAAKGRREIDAGGHLVTPGWVDIHTHYDGQVSWDAYLSPSCWHGVTTVVMGNCGVGFAPVAPHFHDQLINIMEGVEDIPGSALSEGITWGWESFPEYLDTLGAKTYALDVAAQLPHAALRTYVMGERGGANLPATPDEIARMAQLAGEAMDAGAFGFTTSRITAHRTADGEIVPGTQVSIDEMEGIGAALGKAGHGVFEVVSDMNFDGIPGSLDAATDIAWMGDISRRHGVRFTYLLQQNPGNPDKWRQIMAFTNAENAAGAVLMPQINVRPIGIIMGWQSSFHIFMERPSYEALADLPFPERYARLSDPAVRDAILAEASDRLPFAGIPLRTEMMFRLESAEGVLNYEPASGDSVKAEAEARGVSTDRVIYDMLMERGGNGYVYFVIMNYGDYNLEFVRELLDSPSVVIGGSDAGAHCGAICDAAVPTFLISYWTRDRTTGPCLLLEAAVSKQTRETARAYGITDRGVLAPGMKADLNIIDYDAINCSAPKMIADLPAGGKRLIQTATGYVVTMVSGVVTFENGIATGALPGKLLRSKRHADVPALTA